MSVPSYHENGFWRPLYKSSLKFTNKKCLVTKSTICDFISSEIKFGSDFSECSWKFCVQRLYRSTFFLRWNKGKQKNYLYEVYFWAYKSNRIWFISGHYTVFECFSQFVPCKNVLIILGMHPKWLNVEHCLVSM